MTKVAGEYEAGGYLRDRYGRREFVVKNLNDPPAANDSPEGGSIVDADGREQIVLVGVGGTGWINVKDAAYGAVGDGVTDDRAAIQAAINKANTAATGGVVYLPSGDYVVGSPGLVWPTSAQVNITIQGDGMGGTNAPAQATRLIRTGAYALITAQGTGQTVSTTVQGFSLKDLTLYGGLQAATLVQLDRCSSALLENVRMHYSNRSLLVARQLWNSHFTNVWFETSGDYATSTPAVLLTDMGAASSETNTVQFTNCSFEANLGTDCEMAGPTSPCSAVLFTNTKMERTAGNALKFTNAQYCSVVGAYVFHNTTNTSEPAIDLVNANFITIASNVFGASGSPQYFIRIQAGSRNSIVGNPMSGTVSAHIRLESTAADVEIVGNSHGAGVASLWVDDQRSAKTGLVSQNGQVRAYDGLATKVKAGVPADGDFIKTPVDGTIAVDSTNNKLMVRIGGTWKGVTVA